MPQCNVAEVHTVLLKVLAEVGEKEDIFFLKEVPDILNSST